MLLSRVMAGISLFSLILGAEQSLGQDYPVKPIRFFTASAGGGSDFVSRLIGQGISGGLGQPVIVENRGGAIPAEMVSRASPDGYSLLVTAGGHWIEPLLVKTPYDPVRDFFPVTLTNTAPNILVVHPSLPVKSAKELIALAKARPGQLDYASGNTGTATHLAAELFKSMAGVDIVRIPYKSGGTAITDLVGGQVQLSFGSAGSVMSYVKSGRLKALAVTSPEPSPLAPGLPTVAASGLSGYEARTISGIFAPAKTPDATMNRLQQEVARFLKTPEAKEKFLNFGMETVGSSPGEFAATIKSDMAKWGKVIKDAGIRAD